MNLRNKGGIFLSLNFDIQVETIDGKEVLKYFINQKPVEKDTYYKLKADRKENINEPYNFANNYNLNSKQYPDDCEDENCECERCEFIKKIINEIKNSNDEDAFCLLNDCFLEIENDAGSEAFKAGYLSCLRNIVDNINIHIFVYK